ncbi:MAG: hypothetical protein QOF55_1391 [Thermoleophilaceae bacterium]|nr:hypothetical protein [Thermoleophilaceae bacterium]
MFPRLMTTIAATALLLPASASADGLPLPVDDAGPSGVLSPDGGSRYVTVPAGRNTVVERVDSTGGRIAASALLRGKFTIPVVALDGTAAGLSHDGSTLVLIRPRAGFPRARTTLAILAAARLRTRRILTLRGDFSFDALAPDGATTFLVNYVAPNDPTRYRVRALDSGSGRLLPRPVVDPHERGDAMRGYPITRVASPDGRWHYTLYDGAGKLPFVHALDTQQRRAKCIDLEAFPGNVDPYELHLGMSGGGRTLVVATSAGALETIDTTSFRVTPAAPARPAATSAGSHGGSGSGGGVWAAAIGLGLIAAGGLALGVRRRRGRAATVA